MQKLDFVLRRFESAKKNKSEYEEVLKDAYTYSQPDKNYFNTMQGGRRSIKLYDSTAIIGVGTYADKVQQNIVPPWRKWFSLVAGSEIPDEVKLVAKPKLEEITKIIYEELNHSNFNTKINEAFQDVAISTGILTCQENISEGESSLVFDTIGVDDVALTASNNGAIEDVFRTLKLKARSVLDVVPNAKVPQRINDILKTNGETEITLIEGVIKIKNGYRHIIFTEKEKEILLDEDIDSSPFIVFRERSTTKGVYGHGRVIQILNDIKVLNKIVEMDLKNAGLAISGIYTAADDGVLNPYNVKLVPGTIIPVASNNTQSPSLRPLEKSSDFNIASVKIEQYQERIKTFLFGDSLGSIKAPVRTATEISARTNETQEMSNASYSRFQTELLEKLIKRIVDVLVKAGKIIPIKVNGKEITIKFTSPMAKQQDMIDVSIVTDFAQVMNGAGIPPEVIANDIKVEGVPLFVADTIGLPIALIRTEEEKEEREKAIMAQQQMEQAQMMQEEEQGGENA